MCFSKEKFLCNEASINKKLTVFEQKTKISIEQSLQESAKISYIQKKILQQISKSSKTLRYSFSNNFFKIEIIEKKRKTSSG